jgi:hypothetical protein
MLLCVSFSGLLRVPVKSFRARPRFDHCVLQVWMVLGSLRSRAAMRQPELPSTFRLIDKVT